RRNRWMLSLSRPTATAFPLTQESRLPPPVIFEACSAFTHVSACLFARSPKVTFTRVLQRICYLLRRPGCFRPRGRLAGWDSPPLEIADSQGVLGRKTAEVVVASLDGPHRFQ